LPYVPVVTLHMVIHGETSASHHAHPSVGGPKCRFGCEILCRRRRNGAVKPLVLHPRRAVSGKLRKVELDKTVRKLVLNGLKLADRSAKGRTVQGILVGIFQCSAAQTVANGRDENTFVVERVKHRMPALVPQADDGALVNPHILVRHLIGVQEPRSQFGYLAVVDPRGIFGNEKYG
jgi:hypothetical protein